MAGAWSTMAFASVTYLPKQSKSMALVDPEVDFNFRVAHMWNGIFIPSMDVTGMLVLPASSVAGSQGIQHMKKSGSSGDRLRKTRCGQSQRIPEI